MKNIIVFFCLSLALCLLSCSGSKEATADVNNVTAKEVVKENPPKATGRTGRRGNSGDREKRKQEMYAKLNLSEKQVELFEGINDKYRKEMITLREDSDVDRASMREIMQTVRAKQNEEVKTILTTDQYKVYTEMQSERRGRRGPPGEGRN